MYTIISNVHKLIKIFRWNPSNCIVKCLKISTKLFENIEKKRWKKSRKFVYIMCRSPFNLTIFFTKLGFYLKLVGRTNHVISRICFKNPKSNSNSGKLLIDHFIDFSLYSDFFKNNVDFFLVFAMTQTCMCVPKGNQEKMRENPELPSVSPNRRRRFAPTCEVSGKSGTNFEFKSRKLSSLENQGLDIF